MLRSILISILLSITTPLFSQDYQSVFAFNAIDTAENQGNILITIAQAVDNSDNIFVIGYYSYVSDFDPSSNEVELVDNNNNDIFIAKYDPNGNLIWAKDIGGAEYNEVADIAIDSSGNIVLTGTINHRLYYNADQNTAVFDIPYSSVNPAYGDYSYILKYSNNGQFMWIKTFGGWQDVQSASIDISDNGNILVTGRFRGECYFENQTTNDTVYTEGNWDIFMVKFDSLGTYSWSKSMGGAGVENGVVAQFDSQENVYLLAKVLGTVDMDPSAGVYSIIGANSSGTDGANTIAKYDPSGNFLWCNYFEDISGFTNFYDLHIDNADDIIVTGNYDDPQDFDPGSAVYYLTTSGPFTAGFVAKYDFDGSFIWAQYIGTSGYVGYRVNVDQNDIIYTGGLNYVGGQPDPFFTKHDPNGNQQYLNYFQGNGNNVVADISVNSLNEPVVCGYFSGTTDFDASGGTYNLSTAGTGASSTTFGFITKYTAVGAFNWAIPFGTNYTYGSGPGQYDDNGSHISMDGMGNIYVSGSFEGPTDFDPSSAEAIMDTPNPSLGRSFVAKYSPTGQYQWAFALDSTVTDPRSIADSSGNVFISGVVYGQSDFDPSVGVSILDPLAFTSAYVAKYDQNSNLQWAFVLEGADPSSESVIHSITLDSMSNVYVVGRFGGTVDFDPSPTTVSFTVTQGMAFIAKYDSNGNYIWARYFDNVGPNGEVDIDVNNDGEVFLVGTFNYTVDIDPSPATFSLSAVNNLRDVFVAKYNALGDFVWGFSIGGIANDNGYNIEVGTEHLYVTGGFADSVDFDPGPGDSSITFNAASSSTFIAKYRVLDGAFKWVFNLDGEWAEPKGLSINKNEEIAVSGRFGTYWNNNDSISAQIDLDPSAGFFGIQSAQYLPNGGDAEQFVAVYDSSGAFIWGTNFPGTINATIDVTNNENVYLSDENELLLTGNFAWPIDYMPGDSIEYLYNYNGSDMFITKLKNCHSSNTADTVIACTSYTWEENVYTTSGDYSQTYATASGCDSVRSLNLTIIQPDLNVTLNGSTLTSDQNNALYVWVSCPNMEPISGETNQSYTPSISGSFAVIVTVNGCTDTSDCISLTAEVLKNQLGNDFILYPNPTSGKITIDLGDHFLNIKIKQFNTLGQLIKEEEIESTQEFETIIDGAPGTYQFEIFIEGECKIRALLVKQ